MGSAHAGTPGRLGAYCPLPRQAGLLQRAAFDPVLKQYDNAYRAGKLELLDPAAGQRWLAARRAALYHLITIIADTPWRQQLVMFGSFPMTAWFGAAAREPGDIDFVVTPFSLNIHSGEAEAMLTGIVREMRNRPGAGLAPELAQASATWTYERINGQRLTIPFTTEDGLTGAMRIDFVFNEPLPLKPVTIRFSGVDHPVLSASPALSLAWKLRWLATDIHPQGKDLYDATLLAEYTTVSLQLIRDLLQRQLSTEADEFAAESVLDWDIDWNTFTDDYPGIRGSARAWKHRLALALDRGFSD
ncbi:Nucleotidyl transferase AbiEii toxin, Type IV TA system [Micromonospora echinaurantiaca]|uniref:Nucleotidyl transferase AbiEii toxin, Type IV TA system n=1 Tax=Micromonospora echinaurantiaca TaxID=47857 RepID=A0A1C5IGB5_9ACTN|nr:nucleotidyl transferase AbiEii/AbiGii toxin family protein [Micromonospora echinaurantiaca]SCG57103.1 Nucleotidyl transferase AbiEii toxin, Type IV TA system [Micromonospora echinaurantiaca]